MDQQLLDRLAIRDLVENWAVWRDAGDWERFATVWHEEGWMSATWFQGPARDFMRVSQEGFAKGVRILHFLGGTSIDLAGERAIAQTKMTISQRAPVHDVLCDVVCTGRFYDFLEKRQIWQMGHRPPPADLREGPDRPGRSRRDPPPRPAGARRAARRLPPPRLHAGADRLQGQARHAGPDRPRGREALWRGAGLAGGEGQIVCEQK